MPQIKSAKKRAKQTLRRTAKNRAHKERLKKAVKAFKAGLRNPEVANDTALNAMQKAFDKAAVKGVLHKNAVNRRKSRAARAVNKLAAEAKQA